jgi:hypothetical protein
MRPFLADLFCATLLALGAASASWAGQAPSPVGSASRTPAPGSDLAPPATAARSIPADSRISLTEQRWLQGAWPVIAHARQTGVPLDVIVQPQPAAGAAPLAMAFVDGRCKLVLSMRGNAQAQATLDAIAPPLLDATLEMMAAHELGHCRRYLDGAWYGMPAGFVAATFAPAGLTAELQAMYAAMQATRREEAYGDLVGLAWTRQHHPELFERLLSWLMLERSTDLIPGSHHDTLAWLQLAGNGAALAGPSMYADAATLWAKGLTPAP